MTFHPTDILKMIDVVDFAHRVMGDVTHLGWFTLEWDRRYPGQIVEQILSAHGIPIWGRGISPDTGDPSGAGGTLFCHIPPDRSIQAWHVLRGCGVPMVTPEPQAQAGAKPVRTRRQRQSRQRRGNLLDSLVEKIMK